MQDTVFYTKKTLGVRSKILDLSSPIVMGILNTTPDSFYAGSRYATQEAIVNQARVMLEEGATILDIGGYSSRPGAAMVEEQEEVDRVVPAIEAILTHFPEAILSIDTFRSKVASAAVAAGASIVNDISGGELDADMFASIGKLQVPYILMHMRGTPQTMTTLNVYEDILWEMMQYFEQKVFALRKQGVKDIIIDPGFGFAKNIQQNYFLLKNLTYFQILHLPILAGLSRKSLIYKKLHISVEEALNGTTVLNTLALTKGASILRVHDVKAAVEAVKLFNLCNE